MRHFFFLKNIIFFWAVVKDTDRFLEQGKTGRQQGDPLEMLISSRRLER